MEGKRKDRVNGGDAAPSAEQAELTPPCNSPARIALYEVQRERGIEPEEPMESLLQEKLKQEGRSLDIDKAPAEVAPYAEIEVPPPPPDSPARLALYEVQRERGVEPEELAEGHDAA
jgi:hypothetical protein